MKETGAAQVETSWVTWQCYSQWCKCVVRMTASRKTSYFTVTCIFSKNLPGGTKVSIWSSVRWLSRIFSGVTAVTTTSCDTWSGTCDTFSNILYSGNLWQWHGERLYVHEHSCTHSICQIKVYFEHKHACLCKLSLTCSHTHTQTQT